jgi:hypothetical protein
MTFVDENDFAVIFSDKFSCLLDQNFLGNFGFLKM